MLNKVAGHLQKVSDVLEEKTVEDVFGDYVAMLLKQIDDKNERNRVQYEIHGILLKRNK